MNNRELLELAAKAAGYKTIQYKDLKADALDVRYGIDEAIWNGENYWNPLIDDGDALRLAVQLGLLHIDELLVHYSGEVFKEVIDGDMGKAVRRVIVLAAAHVQQSVDRITNEIGKEQA